MVWTSGGIDKLEIYRKLGVREVWFWNRGQIAVYLLEGEEYEPRPKSSFVPDLDLALLASFVDVSPLSRAVREYVAALRA